MQQSPSFDDLKALFEWCPDLLCIASLDGYFIEINQAWSKLLGWTREELLSRPFFDLVHPDDVEPTIQETKRMAQDGQVSVFFENRYRTANGEWIWLAWGSQTRNGKIYGFAKDISRIKRSEEFLTQIQKEAKIGGWSLNIKDFSTSWTDETYRIHEVPLGTPTDTQRGINFFHPDWQEKISKYVKDCIEKKKPYDDIFRFITAKGRHIWARATGAPVLDKAGNVTKLIGTFQDVDSLMQITERLHTTTEKLNSILANSPGVVYQFQINADGYAFFPYASQQSEDLYERSAEELEKDPALMIKMTHPEDVPDLQQKITTSKDELSHFDWSGRILTGTGKIKWIRAKSVPQRLDQNTVLWTGIMMDITREKELEINLTHQRKIAEHSARLASIGELAAGVGHEINNPLAIVMGNNEKIRRHLEVTQGADSVMLDTIRKQKDAADRIRKIVHGLRSLARAGRNDDEQTSDPSDAFITTIDLVAEIYAKEGVSIRVQRTETPTLVKCSTTQLQQILMNLVSNAKDAAKANPNPTIIASLSDAKDFVKISVKDNGTGISKENEPKIFSAFFTTKEVGQGTGLGLAISKSIVDLIGGHISFSTGTSGTTFDVMIPKVKSTLLKLAQ
jgi:PAS domain S-box-containing protein